ncbi:MAG: hypothetical protein Q8P99_00595 [bacterium]|nr:hypothetical protein [bacterium]
MGDKSFSTLETVFALLLVAPLDFVEAGLGFTGLTSLLSVADRGVTFIFAMWLMLKSDFGGTTLMKATTKWVAVNAVELIPFLEILPMRTVVMIVIIRQINKRGEDEEEGNQGEEYEDEEGAVEEKPEELPLAA